MEMYTSFTERRNFKSVKDSATLIRVKNLHQQKKKKMYKNIKNSAVRILRICNDHGNRNVEDLQGISHNSKL